MQAIDWAARSGIHLVNLSLGTARPEHRAGPERGDTARALGRCRGGRGRADEGIRWLPGSLPGVVSAQVDWNCPSDRYRVGTGASGNVVFLASGFPREIPGVPPALNLKGVSFAVANMTGFVARALEARSGVSFDELIGVLSAGPRSASVDRIRGLSCPPHLSNDAAVAEYDAVVIGGGPGRCSHRPSACVVGPFGTDPRQTARSGARTRRVTPAQQSKAVLSPWITRADRSSRASVWRPAIPCGGARVRAASSTSRRQTKRLGFQVFRPDLDRLLLAGARDAGARVSANATVRHVRLDQAVTLVEYEDAGISTRYDVVGSRSTVRVAPGSSLVEGIAGTSPATACRPSSVSGTAKAGGVCQMRPTLWLRRSRMGGRGRCRSPGTTRHLVVDGRWGDHASQSRSDSREHLSGRTRQSQAPRRPSWRRRSRAGLGVRCVPLFIHAYGGSNFLLVGDAGSSIDPLSSFGVKKALASAWVGAVAVHTCPARTRSGEQVALEFFSARERQMYTSNLHRSREYAREAYARHPTRSGRRVQRRKSVPGAKSSTKKRSRAHLTSNARFRCSKRVRLSTLFLPINQVRETAADSWARNRAGRCRRAPRVPVPCGSSPEWIC